jgi:hypothetical protein
MERRGHYYSDDLFQQLLCTQPLHALPGMCANFHASNIPRISAKLLSQEQFVTLFEQLNRPVVVTDALDHWALRGCDLTDLAQRLGEAPMRATSATAAMPAAFSMSEYLQYIAQTRDEVPFYLFDRNFASLDLSPSDSAASCTLEEQYSLPAYFDPACRPSTDLFRLLGTDRPDYRWLVLGPPRSGSIYHIDPNQTHAWNAVLKGRKKWIFYPPHTQPPGVVRSEDSSEVTVPISTAEWLRSFWAFHLERREPGMARTGHGCGLHSIYRDLFAHCSQDGSHRLVSLPALAPAAIPAPLVASDAPLECTQAEGELIFVPHNYWHMVLNLEASLALTHNYVSSSNLADVLAFLRDTPEQISGIRDRVQAVATLDPSASDRSGSCSDSSSYGAQLAAGLYEAFLEKLSAAMSREDIAAALDASYKVSARRQSEARAQARGSKDRKRAVASELEAQEGRSKKPCCSAESADAEHKSSAFSFGFAIAVEQ